jgi:hypothetical protein
MATRVMPRFLVLVRRIADALDRMAPPPPRISTKKTEFSVATDLDFTRGYDTRNDTNADR